MKIVFHPASERGSADYGWLKPNYSFSFAGWHNPERMHFGALRVLNDDYIAGGGGFDTHPHDNMEIVTIPLSGAIEHRDSMGNYSVIRAGEVQIMSAGTGITHSERNHSKDEPLTLFQIWVFPNKKGLTPTYDQINLDLIAKKNELQCVVSPDGSGGVKINQNSWFSLGDMVDDWQGKYELHGDDQGVYAMVVEGEVEIAGKRLGRRDAIGVWDTKEVEISAQKGSKILLIEVPMHW